MLKRRRKLRRVARVKNQVTRVVVMEMKETVIYSPWRNTTPTPTTRT